MNSTIADSIIIRVGHGIMTIPRNIKDFKQVDISSGKNDRKQETAKENKLKN
jgi:hypothetical protein